MTFRYKIVKTIPEIVEAIRLRIKVFHIEQKVNPLIEFDKYDKTATHFIALNKKDIIGTARVRILGKKGKIERMAVYKKFRNKGVGAGLLKLAVNYLKKKKIQNIYLNAQCSAKPFYEKLGFKGVGKIFYEANIKHINMVYKN